MYFRFHDPPTTQIYTLSLHDALPISRRRHRRRRPGSNTCASNCSTGPFSGVAGGLPFDRFGVSWYHLERKTARSEEHTSELQSRQYLVCRLLLEKKKKKNTSI